MLRTWLVASPPTRSDDTGSLRYLAFDDVEEAGERLMPVPLHATARLQRQRWLDAVERLDLALFINGWHHCLRRRVEVEADESGRGIA